MGTYKKDHGDAKRPERTIPICLQADLVAEWEAADRELTRMIEARTDSKEDAGSSVLAERIRALEAQMLKRADEYRLRALPRFQFRELIAAHPPRLDDAGDPVDEDARMGFNRQTFFPALIRASVVSPELDDEDWEWLLGSDEADGEEGILTDRQFSDLQDAAWLLNRGEVQVPFSLAASLTTQPSVSE